MWAMSSCLNHSLPLFRLLECHEYKVFPPSEDLMFSIWTFSTNHPLSSSLRLVTVRLGTQELKPKSSRLNGLWSLRCRPARPECDNQLSTSNIRIPPCLVSLKVHTGFASDHQRPGKTFKTQKRFAAAERQQVRLFLCFKCSYSYFKSADQESVADTDITRLIL